MCACTYAYMHVWILDNSPPPTHTQTKAEANEKRGGCMSQYCASSTRYFYIIFFGHTVAHRRTLWLYYTQWHTLIHYSTISGCQWMSISGNGLRLWLCHFVTLWYTMIHCDTLRYTTIHYDTLWYTMVHLDIRSQVCTRPSCSATCSRLEAGTAAFVMGAWRCVGRTWDRYMCLHVLEWHVCIYIS